MGVRRVPLRSDGRSRSRPASPVEANGVRLHVGSLQGSSRFYCKILFPERDRSGIPDLYLLLFILFRLLEHLAMFAAVRLCRSSHFTPSGLGVRVSSSVTTRGLERARFAPRAAAHASHMPAGCRAR